MYFFQYSKQSLDLRNCILPSHSTKLNNSSFDILHAEESDNYDGCILSHIPFDCPSLSAKRTHLINSFNSLNSPFTLHHFSP